jgi:hypothetical protein
MTSRDFGFLTLRNTTAYQPNGLPVPPNTVFVTSTNGSGIFTNNMTLSSIFASTLEVNTLISKLKVTSTLNAYNISTGNLTANNAVINTLLSGSVEASTISVISTLNLLNPSGNPLELTWNDTNLYIDGHPVATDGTVSSVSSIHWDANTAGDGNIVNKNLGTGLTKYLVGIGYNKTTPINATLDVLYAGGLSQGNVLNISTGNNNRLTVDSNGVVSITSSLSTNAINMTSGTITGLSTINGAVSITNSLSTNAINMTYGTITGLSTINSAVSITNSLSTNAINMTSGTITGLSTINGAVSITNSLSTNAINMTSGTITGLSTINSAVSITNSLSTNAINMTSGTITGLSTINGLVWPPEDDALWSRNGSTIYNDNPGGVGIGTSTPSTTLDILGDIRIGSSYSLSNTSSFIVSLGRSGTAGGLPRSALIQSDGKDMTISNQVNGSLAFGTNNFQNNSVLYMSSNGNVGIGTTTPQAKLDVNGIINSNSTVNVISGSGFVTCIAIPDYGGINFNGYLYQYQSGSNSNIITKLPSDPNQISYFNNGGNYGINKTDPQYTLDVNGDIAVNSVKMQTNGSIIGGTISGLYIEDNIGMAFGNIGMATVYASIGTTGATFNGGITLNNNAGAGITLNDGNFTINTAGSISIRGGGGYYGYNTSNDQTIFLNCADGTGSFSGNITAANFPGTSDIRLKNNINTIENPLSILKQLRGVSYYLNKDSSKQIGFIAQEVEKVLPEVVMTDSSPEEYKSITYGNISALIVEAIKELSAKVDLLMNR